MSSTPALAHHLPPPAPTTREPGTIRVADVVVDEASWTVRAGGRALDLTYKEFELLGYLVGHPGRVVTRDTLLQEVWGSDYYGGTRTVDVHIRRLRAKLGAEHEHLIGTVRNVGYRFVTPPPRARERDAQVEAHVDAQSDAGYPLH